MARTRRSAFTLVELLVVVVVIGILAGLMLPAVLGARERARQAQCMNNLAELAKAVQIYETGKQRLPGYVNRFGTGTVPLNWALVLLPHLGREDLWRDVRAGTLPSVTLPQLICPSNDRGQGLSYVANCGMPDNNNLLPGNTPDFAANGVFHNLFGVGAAPLQQPSVRTNEIRDGAQQTLLFSENSQLPAVPAAWLDTDELDIGMVWVWTAYGAGPPPLPGAGFDECYRPNACREGSYYPRPLSNHPGGFLVSYCDGHQQFVSDRIEYLTFHRLMTPDSAAIVNNTASPPTRATLPQFTDPEMVE